MACGEDVYQEIDKQNSGNVEDTSEDPAYTVLTDDSGPGQTGYQSPYDNNVCCSPVDYSFENLTTDLELEFIPYVGFARFDGAYDAMHFAWPINPTLYPNLLLGETDEYFKLVKCDPFFIGPGGADNFGSSAQLPIGPGNHFSITPPTSPSEWTILYEYGKIYAIDAVIKDGGGTIVASERLRFPFLAPGVTQPPAASGFLPMPVHPTNPLPEQYDLWYHYDTFEICVGSDPAYFHTGGDGLSGRPSELTFTHEYAPGQYRDYILSLTTDLTTVRITLQ